MKCKSPWIFILICVSAVLSAGENRSVPEPTADFVLNFSNFPQAWMRSQGEGITIGVIREESEASVGLLDRLALTAPRAVINHIGVEAFLNKKESLDRCRVVFLWEPVKEDDLPKAEMVLKSAISKGIACVIPAVFGPMSAEGPSEKRLEFMKEMSENGAVIVGVHGRAYQLGEIDFWKKIPVDTFVLDNRIDGQRAFSPGYYLEEDLSLPVYQAAGAAALLLGSQPSMSPRELKLRFHSVSRRVYWGRVSVEESPGKAFSFYRPFLTKKGMEEFAEAHKKSNVKVEEKFNAPTFDAGLLLGEKVLESGEWSRQLLRCREANRIATGKGVTVAVLDHSFVESDWSLNGRIVQPGSIIPGVQPLGETASHGTWMARELVRVAPEMKIMPVVIMGEENPGADEYIRGIDYAVEHGADIITLSHAAIASERQADFDAAIGRAVEKGITFVYIHYAGDRRDLVESGAIEFAPFDRGREVVYVVSTQFIEESSFPYTWGLSQTAPMVAGVVAMMKEVNRDLEPAEIRRILLEACTREVDGYRLLDAVKAVKAAAEIKRGLKD